MPTNPLPSLVTCPICRRQFDAQASLASMPFCSKRCRSIDLGRWLGEQYSVPSERGEKRRSEEDEE